MPAVCAPLPSTVFVNPAHMQNAFAGPSSPSKRKIPSTQKRKRTDTTDDSGHESTSMPRKPREGPKKKKANRACFHCQKAHLTCDDCTTCLFPPLLSPSCSLLTLTARPCQRCVKRGIANNCTEGHRKKAKYLLDDNELGMLPRSRRPVCDNRSRGCIEQLKCSKSTSSQEPPSITSCWRQSLSSYVYLSDFYQLNRFLRLM